MKSPEFYTQLVAFLSGFNGTTAYGVILGVLLACGLGVPIPEDITLLTSGILAALGNISFWGAVIVGLIGVLIGDCFLYVLGRKLGWRVFKLPGFRKIFTPARIRMAEEKILRNSKFICFTARFLPGLRSAVFLTAGMMGVKPAIFFTLDGLAALISVPFWIFVGWWFGRNLDDAFKAARSLQIYIFLFVACLVGSYVFYKHRKKKASHSPQV